MSADTQDTVLEQAASKPRGFSQKVGFVAGELGNSFVQAGATTLRIGGGLLTGAATSLIFSWGSGAVAGAAGLGETASTLTQSFAIVMSGPFAYQMFKSRLAENINPKGAFARAAQATSFAMAGIFGPLTLLGAGTPSVEPEDFTAPPSEMEQNYIPAKPLGGKFQYTIYAAPSPAPQPLNIA